MKKFRLFQILRFLPPSCWLAAIALSQVIWASKSTSWATTKALAKWLALVATGLAGIPSLHLPDLQTNEDLR